MTRLRTDRFELSPLSDADTRELHEIWTSPGVRRYLFDDEVLSVERSAALVAESRRLLDAEGAGLWAVRLPESPTVVGFAGLWYFRDPPERELLYGVAERAWGQGVATEAAAAILRYGLERLGYDEIAASTDSANAASVRVMEKLGMTFLRCETVAGLDTIFYSIRGHR